MGRKVNSKSKKRGGKNRSQKDDVSLPPLLEDWNFLSAAGPGCHIARPDLFNSQSTNQQQLDWVLEWEAVAADEFGDDEVPDLAVDPEEHTLTLCNTDACYKVAYITVFDCPLRGRDGRVLTPGTTTRNDALSGSSKSCTTLIVLCPPHTFCHLCYLPDTISPASLVLESDVQEWSQHPNPADTHCQSIGFPLQISDQCPTFLCTQGVGGCLTHFFAGNLHAIDFQCPIGTPLLAVGKGTVVSVKVNCNVTGIAVTNLFSWNSILLKLENGDNAVETLDQGVQGVNEDDIQVRGGPLFVEYVHIQSAAVGTGDTVVTGQVIGTSGSVGFSPEPHLHLACYRSSDDTAPTCRVFFHSTLGSSPTKLFLPKAGQLYNETGLCVP
jgi:Peptidase family M23